MKNSNGIFVAYKGNEVDYDTILNDLNDRCPSGFVVKPMRTDALLFAKLVPETEREHGDPYWNRINEVLTVNSFVHQEIDNIDRFAFPYKHDGSELNHTVTNWGYYTYKEKVFLKLGEFLHFCSVIWDRKTDTIVAGVTTPVDSYTHLYYGETPDNKELIFSNNFNLLLNYCSDIRELESNSFMLNGEVFDLEGKPISVRTDDDTPKR